MSSVSYGPNRKTLTLLCISALVSICLLSVPPTSASTSVGTVKYELRYDSTSPGAFEVLLSFKLYKGGQALLEPEEIVGTTAEALAVPTVEFRIQSGPGYSVSAVSDGAGLTIAASEDVALEVPYRVSFEGVNRAQRAGEAPGNAKPTLPITLNDLQVFKASQVLICPRRPGTSTPLSDAFSVELTPGAGNTVLTPWERVGKGSSFEVKGETGLLENYAAMGRIETLEEKRENCTIEVGFASDRLGLTSKQRGDYVGDLAALFSRMEKTMGARPELGRLSVLVAGLDRYGLEDPAGAGLYESLLTFTRGESLEGESAAVAAGSMFELWNGWKIVPAEDGGALWFSEGMPWFFSYRAAAEEGLLGSGQAYSYFSRVYLDYVSDPMAPNTSLSSAQLDPLASSLVMGKGAVLCASLAKRLADQTNGEKDIDWFLGELAGEFDNFKGKTYTLVDITEIVESETKKSWDRFFDERLNGTALLPPSEFSNSDLFGTGGVASGTRVETKASGRSWLILLVVVLFLFMVPLIFSAYVRRSVKLDLSMPKILPEDEEENEE